MDGCMTTPDGLPINCKLLISCCLHVKLAVAMSKLLSTRVLVYEACLLPPVKHQFLAPVTLFLRWRTSTDLDIMAQKTAKASLSEAAVHAVCDDHTASGTYEPKVVHMCMHACMHACACMYTHLCK